MLYLAWSADENTRREASSGGFTRECLRYSLETGYVEKVVCIKLEGIKPEVIITNNPDDFMNRKCVSVYNETKDFLRTLKDVNGEYACTVLPCHIDFLTKTNKKPKLSIEILCNYWPKKDLTIDFLNKNNVNIDDVEQLYYRGDGWPGTTTIVLKNGKIIDYSFSGPAQFWSNDRKEYGPSYCQKCSRLSCGGDFIVGDPWDIPGDMGNGKTLVKVNAEDKEWIIGDMVSKGYINVDRIDNKLFAQSVKTMIERKIELCK